MGNSDSLPVVSQSKSFVQWISGNSKAAKNTQENFIKGCPLVSQIIALCAYSAGKKDYAKKSQKYFLNNMLNVVDSIPIVGHAKGIYHYSTGNIESGHQAMAASSRTICVAAAGTIGFIAGGPVGAYPGGIAGGIVADSLFSAINKWVIGGSQLYGHISAISKLIDGNLDAGEGFDWILMFVFDAMAGKSYAKQFLNIRTYLNYKRQINRAIKEGKLKLENGQTASKLASQLQNTVHELQKAIKNKKLSKKSSNLIRTLNLDIKPHSKSGHIMLLENDFKILEFNGKNLLIKNILQKELSLKIDDINGLMEAISSPERISVKLPDGLKAGKWDQTKSYMFLEEYKTVQVPMEISLVSYKDIRAAVVRCQPCHEIVNLVLTRDEAVNTSLKLNDFISHCVNNINCEEMVSIAYINDFIIIGSKKEFVEELLCMLQLKERNKILVRYEVEWPIELRKTKEKLSRLVISDGIAKGFNEKQILEILNRKGSKAKTAIYALIKNLKIEIEKESKQDKKIRSKRGEHVINKGVIPVYKDIIDGFLQKVSVIDGNSIEDLTRLPNDSKMRKDYHKPIADDIRSNIEYKMKVHIPTDVFYFDANAAEFGNLISVIQESAILHMEELYYKIKGFPKTYKIQISDLGSQHTSKIKTSVFVMNDNRCYVDLMALRYWEMSGGNRVIFESSNIEVYRLFQNLYDNLSEWILELIRRGY